MSDPVHERIQSEISSNPVMLYMKGNAMFPQCGFSARVVQILTHLGVPFQTANVLEDAGLREGIKEFSNWPTIPQLYVNGEFVGGCDIITEMYQSGELETLMKREGRPAPGRPPDARRPASRGRLRLPARAGGEQREGVVRGEPRDLRERRLKQPVAALVDAVTTELTRRGVPLEGDPKRSTFRIHRDVRFSKDKSPYKTAVGAVWYRQGSGKDGAGVLYFHLAPGRLLRRRRRSIIPSRRCWTASASASGSIPTGSCGAVRRCAKPGCSSAQEDDAEPDAAKASRT